MIRAVLDTNVLAAGFVSDGGLPGHILSLCSDGVFELVTSAHIMAEFASTLAKSYF